LTREDKNMATTNTGWTLYKQYRRQEREMTRRRNHNAADPELSDVRSDLRRNLAAALAAVQAAADAELMPEDQAAEADAAARVREKDAVARARAEADRPTEKGPLSAFTGHKHA
jgi:hypothetical protein